MALKVKLNKKTTFKMKPAPKYPKPRKNKVKMYTPPVSCGNLREVVDFYINSGIDLNRVLVEHIGFHRYSVYYHGIENDRMYAARMNEYCEKMKKYQAWCEEHKEEIQKYFEIKNEIEKAKKEIEETKKINEKRIKELRRSLKNV